MIRETITFSFQDKQQQKAFHAVLKRRLGERDLVTGWDAVEPETEGTVAYHLEQMMREADVLNGAMNNAGFRFLGHLVTEEHARVSLAFAAMVVDYAKRHGITVRNPADKT